MLLFTLGMGGQSCDHLFVSYVPIYDLITTPDKFTGKPLCVQGKVMHALKLPFLTSKVYTIRDSSGELLVETEREPPTAGSTAHVQGTLERLAIIEDQSIGLHIREIERW